MYTPDIMLNILHLLAHLIHTVTLQVVSIIIRIL